MKNSEYSKDMELMERLDNKEPFNVIYDGEDFGVYKYNPETNKYEGDIGYLTIQSMLNIIKGLNDFIELK